MQNAIRPMRVLLQLAILAGLAALNGCAVTGTTIGHVERDGARRDVPLGRTLVLALTPDMKLTTALESEWVRQLRSRGVEAELASKLLPGGYPPDEPRVVELVTSRGFDTLLTCRLVRIKQAGRDATRNETAVTETRLYDARSGQPFWTAQADTFFLSSKAGGQVSERDSDRISEFVGTLVRELSNGGAL